MEEAIAPHAAAGQDIDPPVIVDNPNTDLVRPRHGKLILVEAKTLSGIRQ